MHWSLFFLAAASLATLGGVVLRAYVRAGIREAHQRALIAARPPDWRRSRPRDFGAATELATAALDLQAQLETGAPLVGDRLDEVARFADRLTNLDPLERESLRRRGLDPTVVIADINTALAAGNTRAELLALDRLLLRVLEGLAAPELAAYRA